MLACFFLTIFQLAIFSLKPLKFELLLSLFSQFRCLIIIMENLIIYTRFTSDSL